MLSLVTGKTVGVSKSAKPVIIRMPRRNSLGGATPEDYIEGLSKVNDDLQGKSTEARAILLMSLLFPRSLFMRDRVDQSAGFSGRMQQLLADLGQRGVLIVTGSGNSQAVSFRNYAHNQRLTLTTHAAQDRRLASQLW